MAPCFSSSRSLIHRASASPWARSLGQRRKVYGPAPLTSGADDDGEIATSGAVPLL